MYPVNKGSLDSHIYLWKGIENHSMEHCLIRYSEQDIQMDSVIIGYNQKSVFRVDYSIRLNQNWELIEVNVEASIDGIKTCLNFLKDQNSKWSITGQENNLFDGCTEIDLPLTPLTNTLPIKRLKMEIGESQIIRVIYIDLLDGSVQPVDQKYTRLSALTYKYENVPNDFEAVITVDDSGFVIDYPGLFARVYEVNYRK